MCIPPVIALFATVCIYDFPFDDSTIPYSLLKYMWLNISDWSECQQKPFWIRLTVVQQGQNLSNSW